MFTVEITSLNRKRVELALHGAFQLGPATEMLAAGLPVLFGHWPTVVLDVGGVTHFDAAAIAALKLLWQLARRAGTNVVLIKLNTKDLVAAVPLLLNFDCAYEA